MTHERNACIVLKSIPSDARWDVDYNGVIYILWAGINELENFSWLDKGRGYIEMKKCGFIIDKVNIGNIDQSDAANLTSCKLTA